MADYAETATTSKDKPRGGGKQIYYFTRKPTAKEKKQDPNDFRAANARALDAAQKMQLLWAAQYARDTGGPPPRYNQQHVKAAPAPKRIASDRSVPGERSTPSTTKPKSKRKPLAISGTPSNKKVVEYPDTPAGETAKLKADLEGSKSVVAQLKAAMVRGEIPDIPDISGTKKKNWFERNVGQKVGAVGSAIEHSVVGDVAGRGLNLFARPISAAAGAFNAYSEQANKGQVESQIEIDQDLLDKERKKIKPNQNLLRKLEDDIVKQKTNLQEMNKSGYGTKSAATEAKLGITGKTQHSLMESVQPGIERQIPALKIKPGDKGVMPYLKMAPAFILGLAGDVTIDPLSGGAGIRTAIKGVKAAKAGEDIAQVTQAVNKLHEVSPAYRDLIAAETHVDDLESAYRAEKSAKGLKELQQANKELEATRKGLLTNIRVEGTNAGLLPHELEMTGYSKSIAGKLLDTEKGLSYLTPEKAVRDIIEEATTRGRKISAAEQVALVAQKAEKMAQETGVLEKAKEVAAVNIKQRRAMGEVVGAAARKQMVAEAVAEQVSDRVVSMNRLLDEALKKRFQVNILGKDISAIPGIEQSMRALYIPFEATGKAVRGTALGEGFGKAFHMGAHFPGSTDYIRQMAESHGITELSDFVRKLRSDFQGLSHSESEEIARAIQNGHTISDPKLEALRQLAEAHNKTTFDILKDIGKYKEEHRVKNFLYHYYQKGSEKTISEFKRDRKAVMRSGKKGPTLEAAAQQGFKPQTRIEEILISQHRDLIRQVQRSNFRQGILSNFGTLTDNPELARQLGLVPVSKKLLGSEFHGLSEAKGATWYLPKEVHNTFKTFDEMMGIGHNAPANAFLQLHDKIIKGFKTSATIANPGNWVNNSAGDIFMNWTDGVKNPLWYSKSAAILHLNEESAKTVKIAGRQVKALDILDAFKRKAPSGGFIRTEGSALGKTRFVRGTQNAYESREEWGRLAHFMSALNEETSMLMKSGKTFEQAFDAATERAARRVAKFNFDYTAITPVERQIRKNFVPFYTYMRKAAPLMLEGMIARPGKLVHWDIAKRNVERLLGVPHEGDDGVTWPFWAQQAGAMRISGGEEPFALRDPTPLNVFNRLVGGDSPRDVAANIGNQLNPLARIGIEQMYGKTLFNQRDIENQGEYWAGQIPSAAIVARAAGHPFEAADTQTPSRSIGERIAASLGIPVTQITQNRQQSELRRQQEQVPNVTSVVNKSIAPLKITKFTTDANGTYYTISNTKTKKVVGRYRDYEEAIKAASKK